MQAEFELPLNQRVKQLFFKEDKNSELPIVVLETYKKTIAELDLNSSAIHFKIRSHYQKVNNIVYEKIYS